MTKDILKPFEGQHTPLPWKKEGLSSIYGADLFWVAEFDCDDCTQDDENMRFILHCVNTHEPLRERAALAQDLAVALSAAKQWIRPQYFGTKEKNAEMWDGINNLIDVRLAAWEQATNKHNGE